MKLCVVAGEASGDLHASEVVHELRKLDPSLELFGIGGDLLARQGMELRYDFHKLGVVGLFNVVRHLPMFRRVFADIVSEIERKRPDAILLVDYPDFNLRLAKRCSRLGIPIFYYISPQIWAWRKGRVKHIAKHVDHMIVIFPFEEQFYKDNDVDVTYVGHPLVEQLSSIRRDPARVPAEPYRIALLPGSRRMEVETLLPPMLDALRVLSSKFPVRGFVVKAPTIGREQIDAHLPSDASVEVREGRDAVSNADVALCSSGTATLETAVVGVPAVVVYRLTRLTYLLAKRLVRLPNFSLVNIVAGKRIIPELLQDEVNGPRIAEEAARLLQPANWTAVVKDLAAVRERLGSPGASARAADRIYTLLQARGARTE